MRSTVTLCCSLADAPALIFFFFFNDTATTEIYTLSLHDALPISKNTPVPKRDVARAKTLLQEAGIPNPTVTLMTPTTDRKSTRLNSSHSQISYAVFCLKKKKQYAPTRRQGIGYFTTCHNTTCVMA